MVKETQMLNELSETPELMECSLVEITAGQFLMVTGTGMKDSVPVFDGFRAVATRGWVYDRHGRRHSDTVWIVSTTPTWTQAIRKPRTTKRYVRLSAI